jgi:hypothetical protein
MRRPKCLEPSAELTEGLAVERIDSTLTERVHRDQACSLQRLEVLGRLWLAQAKLLGNLADRPRRGVQKLDDSQAIGLAESGEERRVHP